LEKTLEKKKKSHVLLCSYYLDGHAINKTGEDCMTTHMMTVKRLLRRALLAKISNDFDFGQKKCPKIKPSEIVKRLKF